MNPLQSQGRTPERECCALVAPHRSESRNQQEGALPSLIRMRLMFCEMSAPRACGHPSPGVTHAHKGLRQGSDGIRNGSTPQSKRSFRKRCPRARRLKCTLQCPPECACECRTGVQEVCACCALGIRQILPKGRGPACFAQMVKRKMRTALRFLGIDAECPAVADTILSPFPMHSASPWKLRRKDGDRAAMRRGSSMVRCRIAGVRMADSPRQDN